MNTTLLCVLVLMIFGGAFGRQEPASDNPNHGRGRQREHHKMHTQGKHTHMDDDNGLDVGFRRGHGHKLQNSGDPCPTFCTFDYKPVCGSDGKTYSNKCSLSVEACSKGKRMYVKKEGKC